MLMYGSLGGQSFQPGLANILFRDVRLHGFYLSNWIDRLAPDQFHEFSNTVMMLLADGVMQTRTVDVFPLALFKQAILRSQVNRSTSPCSTSLYTWPAINALSCITVVK